MLSHSIISIFSFFLFICSPMAAYAKGAIGAVASGHPLATKAGLDVLAEGGNAFDAAVAIASTLNVVEPAMTGLGGYGSTLIYDAKKKEVRYLNSSGKFPLNANSDLMRAPAVDYMSNRKGPKSISTPGNLNAWKVMHARYGRLPWADLFEHAIMHARDGFPLAPYMAKLIASSFDEFSDYSKSFYGKNGRPLKEGEKLVQKDLANTYTIIASEGVDPFYKGRIALQIDTQLKELGSFLSLEDLRADVAEWWDPLKINYKGYDIYTMGTPGNGFSALFALGVLEQLDLQKLTHNSSDYLHLVAEVLKESSKVRLTHSGTVETRDNIENHILTPVHFAQVAASLDITKASHFDVHPRKEGLNTTHFVVVDKWGNIVSSTQTLGLGFGSKVMIEGTGVWMNNAMAFSTWEPKGNPMDVFPGQYKLSSNSPIIIMNKGQPWAALGTPGGHTIPQNVAQIIVNLIDFKMNMQQAINAPKLAFFAEENVLITERDIPVSVVSALKKKGHQIDNEHITSYLGLSGAMGNAMGVKIFRNKENLSFDVGIDRRSKGNKSFDIGVDKRRDAWSTTHTIPAIE